MSGKVDDIFHALIDKRVKAVLRSGLGLVGTLVEVSKSEAQLELDTGGQLVVMKHTIQYVEPIGESEA